MTDHPTHHAPLSRPDVAAGLDLRIDDDGITLGTTGRGSLTRAVMGRRGARRALVNRGVRMSEDIVGEMKLPIKKPSGEAAARARAAFNAYR